MTFCIRTGPSFGCWTRRDRLAREVLRILDDVLDRVDRRDRGLGLGERLEHLLGRPLADPVLDDRVELVGVLDPARVVAEPRLVDQVLAPDDPHHPLGDRLGARREPEPAPVLRAVGVARRGERRAIARAPLDDAELVVDQRLRAEHPEQRLVDREVDHLALALAAVLAPPEREHRREAAGQRRDPVAERERRQRRRLVRPAVDVREAGDRLGERPEAGQLAVRPGLAEPGRPHDHKPRVDLVQHVRARGSSAPASRAGSSRSGRPRPATSRFSSSWPSGSESLSVTQRLLRATSAHQSETPSFCQPIERRSSPRGCSTLITSAPKSPIIVAITGPANSVAQSTTLRPSSGRASIAHAGIRPSAERLVSAASASRARRSDSRRSGRRPGSRPSRRPRPPRTPPPRGVPAPTPRRRELRVGALHGLDLRRDRRRRAPGSRGCRERRRVGNAAPSMFVDVEVGTVERLAGGGRLVAATTTRERP